jgi:ATP-dependent DNA ligase
MRSRLELILNAFTLIKETNSRLEKDKIMKRLIKDEKTKALLTEMLTYTFHPYWNYWVRWKDGEGAYRPSHTPHDKHWSRWKEMLDKLRNREITGDKARDYVEAMVGHIPCNIVDWFIQILNRDIKIGMQLKSFEKHLGEFVPKCYPMLAETWGEEEIEEEIAIEEKLDGLRCHLIFPKKGEPTSVSRNGRPIYNTEIIFEELKRLHGTGWIVDGELRGEDKSWGSSVSGAHSKNKKVKGLHFVAFDILNLTDWEKRKCKQPWEERRSCLKHAVLGTPHVSISKAEVGTFSVKEIKKIAKRYIEKGGEGIIIKPIEGTYDFKRSSNWLKYKFKDNVDCKVIGRVEGKHKNKGKLGALIVEGRIDGKKFRSEVGQGLSDENRTEFWEMPEKELKRLVVEIEHYGLTDSLRLHKGDKLPAVRNGVFLKIREDKMER